ncbi:methyltransferase domain-containing protein [Aspergillus floccosus]
MADESHPTYLSPSELGTKDYWETFYARTLSHISSKHPTDEAPSHRRPENPTDSNSDDDESVDDDDDPGTSWFSEHNAPDKVLHFLTDASFPLAPCNNPQPPASVLDLGTGNGSMLALLRTRGGFTGRMVGVDYSARSVELARELQRGKMHSAYNPDSDDEQPEGTAEQGGGGEEIRFEEWDILAGTDALADDEQGNRLDWFPYAEGGFDIVLDKGTFDAVSLSEETVGQGQRVCERYPGIVRRLVRKGGFVVVTSCNWTEEELVSWFTPGDQDQNEDKLVVHGRVEYPRFRFGGMEGQGVCTVCFQRV